MNGKQIESRTPQEERQQQQRENLFTAIAKLTWLGSQFAKVESQTGARPSAPDYYTFAELFARDSKGQTPSTFARHKVEAIEQTLQEVRELTSPEYYETHPVYKYALQYIGYLQGAAVEADQNQSGHNHKRGRKQQTPAFVSYFTDRSKYKQVLKVLKQHQQEHEAAPAAKIIAAAQDLGYIARNINAAALHRALKPLLDGLASERAFRAAIKTANPQEYKTELEQA